MVDWTSLQEEWETVSEDLRAKILALFREKPKDRLAELFRREPSALLLYEKVVEPVTDVKVRVTIDAGADVGTYFGTYYYDSFELGSFMSPSTSLLKSHLEAGEEWVDFTEQFQMQGLEFEQAEEQFKELPWPFNTGARIRVYWKYPEDVEFTEKAKEQWDIFYKTYTAEDLEVMKVEELQPILKIKKLSTAGRKEELISRILGVPYVPPEKPPPVAAPPVVPPVAAPPEKRPPKAAPPPAVEKGLGRADERRLLTRFEASLLEKTVTPGRWRPMFNEHLYDWRSAFKDLPREDALSRALTEVERLVSEVVGLAKPPVRPVVRPPVVPEEVLPVVPLPPVVPVAPPAGLERRWGMPWAMFECPAHVGEGGPPDQLMVLRSKYLEARLMRLALPTGDQLFFELCDYHRQRYGGAFEKYPRYKVEFWVGEAIAKAETDIATLVGLGISEAYCLYALDFYEATKHLAVQ